MALKLAHDPAYLASLRDRLARNKTNTFPLFDTERTTRQIEAAYTMMWERYQSGEGAGSRPEKRSRSGSHDQARPGEPISPMCEIFARALPAAAQVGFDQKLGIVFDERAIDLHVLDHALDVIARFRDRNALDPVDRIYFGIAWIAVLFDPFLRAAWAGIVGDKGEDVGAAPRGDVVAELRRAKLGVIDDVVGKPALIEGDIELLGGVAAGRPA